MTLIKGCGTIIYLFMSHALEFKKVYN
jgi:hypothetical protein